MNKALIIVSLFSALLVSCSDYLNTYPQDGLVAERYWNNKEELDNVMMGAYAAFADLDAHLFLNGEMRADMLTSSTNISNCNPGGYYNNGDVRDVMIADILPTNKLAKWNRFYKVINYCNFVIKYAPVVQERDVTFKEYYMTSYIAEATTLRSLAYFYLVRIFKDVPYITEPSETDEIDIYPYKTSGDSIIANIVRDLSDKQMVEKLATFYGDVENTKGRMNRYAGYALLADIGLWSFDYNLTIEYVEKIENSTEFEMLSNSEWFTMFGEGNTDEGIFEIQYKEVNGRSNKMYDLTKYNSGYKYFIASPYAEKLFIGELEEVSVEQARADGTLVRPNKDNEFYIPNKYVGQNTSTNSVYADYREHEPYDANFIIYRFTDVLLMKAEALVLKESPDFAAAMDIVNRIRIRANVPVYNAIDFGTSEAQASLNVMNERALELAYEGKRWFDLLRFVRRDVVANKNTFIDFITSNLSPSQRLVMASKLYDENSWYLPIYIDEIDNNPNLEQNPYYDGL